MHMRMIVIVLVPVTIVDFHRHHVDATVTHFGLGHQVIREHAHLLSRAAQDQRLHTIVMIQMHMHRRQHQVMMLMLQIGESVGEIPRVVVVHVAQRGHAIGRFVLLEAKRLELGRPERQRPRRAV